MFGQKNGHTLIKGDNNEKRENNCDIQKYSSPEAEGQFKPNLIQTRSDNNE